MTIAQRDDVLASRAAYQQSVAAYEAQDYETFREQMAEASRLRPGHSGLLYNVAAGYALTNQPAEAMEWLNRYAAMGLVAAPQEDADFASIHETEAFAELLHQIEANGQPLVRSDTAFRLQDPAFVPEGIAYDAKTGDFYIGSVHQRRIVRVDAAGEIHDVASEAEGLWSVLGVAIDAGRRRLWAGSAAMAQTKDLVPDQQGQTVLVLFDLDTGKHLNTFPLPPDSTAHVLGDLALNAAGDVFATDGLDGAVYVLREGTTQLEPLVPPQTLFSPQGACFTRPSGPLYLADYALGILTVDSQTGTTTLLNAPANTTLLGIDGLACHGNTLLAIQNGVRPHRVIRLSLNATGTALIHAEVLEANHPAYEEPTLGTVVGDTFFYVANSQWNMFDADGHLPASGLQAPVILRLSLAE